MIHSKRGELTTVMRTIIILVVAILGIYFLVKGITSINETKDMGKLRTFEAEFSQEVSSFARNPYSKDSVVFSLPDSITKICMVNLQAAQMLLYDEPFNNESFNNPLIRDSLESNSENNVFLFDENTLIESFQAGRLSPRDCPPYACYATLNGHIELEFEGLDRFAIVGQKDTASNLCNPFGPAPQSSTCMQDNLEKSDRNPAFCFDNYCYEIYLINTIPGMQSSKISILNPNRARIDKNGFSSEDYVVSFEDYYDFKCDDARVEVKATQNQIKIEVVESDNIIKNPGYIRIYPKSQPSNIEKVIVNPPPDQTQSEYSAQEADKGIFLFNSTKQALNSEINLNIISS